MANATYSSRTRIAGPLMILFTLINLAMALAPLVAWPNYAEALADPMEMITGSGATLRPSVLEYPYFLFWLVPLGFVGLTYLAKASEQNGFARFFAVFPSLLAVACTGWLYFEAGYWG